MLICIIFCCIVNVNYTFIYKSVPNILTWWICIVHNKKFLKRSMFVRLMQYFTSSVFGIWLGAIASSHLAFVSPTQGWKFTLWFFCKWKSKIAIVFLSESLRRSFLRSDMIESLTVAFQSEQFWAKEQRLNVRKSEFPTLHGLEGTNCKFVCPAPHFFI